MLQTLRNAWKVIDLRKKLFASAIIKFTINFIQRLFLVTLEKDGMQNEAEKNGPTPYEEALKEI